MLLQGKKGLVLNVTNANSIGWGVAGALHTHGATVGVGAQNDRLRGKVLKLTDGYERMDTFLCDFAVEGDLQRLHDDVQEKYGKIDFYVHSAAYAKKEDLHGRFIDTSRDGFLMAMDISAYSLISSVQALEPLMNDEGSVVTMSYMGSTRTAQNYNVMGVAKAALESCVRYLSPNLGERGIRINTLSPGPINTVSARGVRDLSGMLDLVEQRAPLKRPYGQAECGTSTVYLVSDLSRGVTGQILFVDSGFNITGF